MPFVSLWNCLRKNVKCECSECGGSCKREHNIYRWAGNLIADLSNVRLVPQETEAMAGPEGIQRGEPVADAGVGRQKPLTVLSAASEVFQLRRLGPRRRSRRELDFFQTWNGIANRHGKSTKI